MTFSVVVEAIGKPLSPSPYPYEKRQKIKKPDNPASIGVERPSL
jgi:hypothetical protein